MSIQRMKGDKGTMKAVSFARKPYCCWPLRSQFMALLDSLETRVELMSQILGGQCSEVVQLRMQLTRNAIQQVPSKDVMSPKERTLVQNSLF